MHAAAAAGRPDVVRLPLDRGADASIRDTNGRTPAECAAAGGAVELANAPNAFHYLKKPLSFGKPGYTS